MYQILSEEGFADQLMNKLVGSEFGQKLTVACEMQQTLLEKINGLVSRTQKDQQQQAINSETGASSNMAAKENKNEKSKNEFDKLIETSLERLKAYAQEQLKRVIAHKESLADGLKNIFKNIKTEIPGLLTAMLGKKMLELFNGWWPKVGKSFEKLLNKIFKTDKGKAVEQSAGEQGGLYAGTSKSDRKGPENQKTSGNSGREGDDSDLYDPATAVKVFKKQLEEKKTNYAQIMEDSFNRINNSAEQHFNKMLTGAESFSQGFKGIFKDMTTEISKMLLTIFYKHVVETSLGKWFGNFLEKIFKAEGGPVSSQTPYVVGERGPELFVPEHAGTIIPNHRLQEAFAAAPSQGVAMNCVSPAGLPQAPPVVVNVVNKSGVQANTRQEAKWDGQQYIVNVVMDAYARNVNGMRDVLGVRR